MEVFPLLVLLIVPSSFEPEEAAPILSKCVEAPLLSASKLSP
jgi:hypothetical protein